MEGFMAAQKQRISCKTSPRDTVRALLSPVMPAPQNAGGRNAAILRAQMNPKKS